MTRPYFYSDCMDSTGCCIKPCCPFFKRFLPLWIMLFQPESFSIPIAPLFLWQFIQIEASRGELIRPPLYFIGLCLGGGWPTNRIWIQCHYNRSAGCEASGSISFKNQSVRPGPQVQTDRKWCASRPAAANITYHEWFKLRAAAGLLKLLHYRHGIFMASTVRTEKFKLCVFREV